MSYVLICVTAFAVSGLTLFSGFGLGTVLMPAFALFFPVPAAIAATAVVHLANNLFKLALVGRDADWGVVLRFSLPAAVAAIFGASLLAVIAEVPALASYAIAGHVREVSAVKAVIGALIVVFAMLEFWPWFAQLALPPRYLALGGLLSGFFGGLSGNQGALRSAFLIKAGLSKEAFVGTNAVSTVIVDTVRLVVYGLSFHAAGWTVAQPDLARLVGAATVSAFLGAFLAARLLKKVTLRFVQITVAAAMTVVGAGLAAGLL